MLPLLIPAFLSAPLLSAGFAVFVTSDNGTGSVRLCTVDSASYSVDPLLAGIRLRECQPAGRSLLDESLSGRALLRSDLEQGTRVLLPAGRGSIYHYERTSALASVYGFFSIDSGGIAHVLIELPAAAGPSDPFLGSLAVRPSGTSMLAPTTPVAGGDLWELFTDGTPPRNRTASLAPQVFGRDSCCLSADLGVAVSTTGVLRFDPHTIQEAAEIGFEGGTTPPWIGLEVVSSSNGQYAALLAGDSQTLARPFVLGQMGDALCMSTNGDFLSGAGFLPEAPNGPWLAVSDDGAQCAWRVGDAHSSGYSHELFMARRNAGAAPTVLHLTQDAIFEPYIDEIGLAFYRPSGQLCFMAGDHGTNNALVSRADLFSATLDAAGAPMTVNLSQTSGDPAPPFLNYGTLELFRLRARPSSGRALIYSRDSIGRRLLSVDFATYGVQVVQTGVESVGRIDTSGSDWLAALELSGPGAHNGLYEVEVPELDSHLMLDLPTISGNTRILRDPNDSDWYAAISSQDDVEHAWEVNLSNGAIRQFSTRDFTFGSSVCFASDGSLIMSLEVAGGAAIFVVWPRTSTSHKLWPIAQPGFVLPAN
ncbi:MAG: hypothetical protein IPJ19_11305 [Planctomycetes bacterium]|nr:hypothetical protein [Planctomycetota bacterium]